MNQKAAATFLPASRSMVMGPPSPAPINADFLDLLGPG
jgi:hypothetical protein